MKGKEEEIAAPGMPDAPDQNAVLTAMRDPAFYPGRPSRVDLVETHISWVLLAGDRAYKVRKPVTFPFLDYGSLRRRREMSEEEIRLGRRLADGIYRGVKAVAPSADGGLTLAGTDAEDAVEYVVEMERFDPDRTLAALHERGELDADSMIALAARVGDFHLHAERMSWDRTGITAIAQAVDDNFATLLPFTDIVDSRTLEAAHHYAVGFLHRHEALFRQRAKEGWIRDCHGDLRLEQVVLRDGVQIPDPVEFDPALRQIDVAADLAFLVMDLHDKDAEHLAEILIDELGRSGVHYGGRRLLYFYATYRAWVRAKVACLRAAGPGGEEEDREEARRLARLGTHLAWKSLGPLTLIVCGRSGSGKSTLAGRLGDLTGMPILSSDVVRKRLHGRAPHEPADEDAYSEAGTAATYRLLGEEAAASARKGIGAIVDATFIRRDARRTFHDAYGGGPTPLFVECTAPESVLFDRSAARAARGGDPSDAGPEIVELQRITAEPFDDVGSDQHLVVGTDDDGELSLSLIEAWVRQALPV